MHISVHSAQFVQLWLPQEALRSEVDGAHVHMHLPIGYLSDCVSLTDAHQTILHELSDNSWVNIPDMPGLYRYTAHAQYLGDLGDAEAYE